MWQFLLMSAFITSFAASAKELPPANATANSGALQAAPAIASAQTTAPPPNGGDTAKSFEHLPEQELIAPAESGTSEEWLHGPESWTAFFTLCLAAITGFLWRATYKLYQATVDLSRDAKAEGDRQAKEMVDSISQATRAATAMERLADESAKSSAATAHAAQATEKTAQIISENAERELRAYLCISLGNAKLRSFHNITIAQADIPIRNYGKTPARNVVVKTLNFGAPHPLDAQSTPSNLDHVYPTPAGLLVSCAAN